MRYLITAFSAVLLLAGGCVAPTPEQYDRIAVQLENINKNLAAMTESYNEYNRLMATAEQQVLDKKTVADSGKESLYMLRRIKKLPKEPTDEQIRKYVEKILKASGNAFCNKESPQVRMLAAIGPGHLELLLPYLKEDTRVYALEAALAELISPNDKELVLENLKELPVLAVHAIRLGWTNEAKETIFEILESGDTRWELMAYVKTLARTPADRKRIVNLYINHKNFDRLYSIIREFPDVDIVSVNNRAWEKQKGRPNANPYAMRAAETGNIEALGYVINGYFDGKDAVHSFSGADVLLVKLTGLPLDKEKLTTWYNTNKDKLYIDEESGRFSIIGQ